MLAWALAVLLAQPVPWNTALGGEIFIHGHGSGSDWTWGCVALDDADIQELYSLIPVGTPVRIHP
jgi:lipoprotein-anchoring transpeptidase ErfK/SrfK